MGTNRSPDVALECGDERGWWTFKNANSGKMLEIEGGSTADGAVAQQWTSNGSTWQQWRLVREGIQ